MSIIRLKPLTREISHVYDDIPLGDFSVDIYQKGRNVIVEMQVPGVSPDRIEVSVEEDRVRIAGSREEKHEVEERGYYHQEIHRGEFERVIPLPCAVEGDQAHADFENGVLVVTLPKSTQAQINKVKITKK